MLDLMKMTGKPQGTLPRVSNVSTVTFMTDRYTNSSALATDSAHVDDPRPVTAQVQVSPGWEPIVRRLIATLRSLDPGYRLVTLDAHDGVLMMGWRPSGEPAWPRLSEDPNDEDRKIYEEAVGRYLLSITHRRRLEWEDQLLKAGMDLIEEASQMALHTCEDCGAPGILRHEGQVQRTQCRPCALEHGFYLPPRGPYPQPD